MNPGVSTDRIYREQVEGFESDKRGRVIPAFGIRRKVIKLDNALNMSQLGIKGDFLYADYNSTGVGILQLNNTSEDGFPILALAGIQDLPFDDVFITSNAQAGLVINLWYGYRSRFVSPTSAIATIGSITTPVKSADFNGNSIDSLGAFGALSSSLRYLLTQDGGYTYGTSFATNTASGVANTPQNIIAAGANLNGYLLQEEMAVPLAGSAGTTVFIAKATAPASVIDGDVLWMNAIGSAYLSPKNFRPVRVAAGKRLDRNTNVIETSVSAFANYTLF